jgi:DNA-binding transcriptional MerR regulator
MSELKGAPSVLDNEQEWRTHEVLAELGISARAFKQMRQLGAVDPAVKRGKGARYSALHLRQAQEVLAAKDKHGFSMPTAAEYVRLRSIGRPENMSKTSNLRRAIDACLHGRVDHVGESVFIAVDSRIGTRVQTELTKELARCAAMFFSVQDLVNEGKTLREAPSVFHRTE